MLSDVQSCAVDPGAVRSSIWKRAGPLMQWVSNHLFAPNADGCQTVVHAATTAWPAAQEAQSVGGKRTDLRVRLFLLYLHCGTMFTASSCLSKLPMPLWL